MIALGGAVGKSFIWRENGPKPKETAIARSRTR
jgi:hypothetical protein